MKFGKKGDWVQIKRVVLTPEQRSSHIPESTKNLPLIMWVKGFLQEDAKVGDYVRVKTRSGRMEEGEFFERTPSYRHDFGECVPELIIIAEQAKNLIFGESN